MLLENLNIRGFRRIELENNLQLSGKLVAIIGPNEAGKTSVLKALSYFNNETPIAETDQTYLSDQETRLKLSFFLEPDDLVAADIKQPTWFDVYKYADGSIKYDLRPQPVRITSDRKKVGSLLEKVVKNRKFIKSFEDNDKVIEQDLILEFSSNLRTAAGELSAEMKSQLQSLKDAIGNISDDVLPKYAKPLIPTLNKLAEYELGTEPFQFALDVLVERVPYILTFGPEDRELELPFDLTRFKHKDPGLRLTPSKPLAEIIRLSGLDLDRLKKFSDAENNAVIQGLLDAANLQLKQVSKGIWTQSDAMLHFVFESAQLDLLVKHEKEFDVIDQYNNFKDRSDGYKQFVALQVFSFLKDTKNLGRVDKGDSQSA